MKITILLLINTHRTIKLGFYLAFRDIMQDLHGFELRSRLLTKPEGCYHQECYFTERSLKVTANNLPPRKIKLLKTILCAKISNFGTKLKEGTRFWWRSRKGNWKMLEAVGEQYYCSRNNKDRLKVPVYGFYRLQKGL